VVQVNGRLLLLEGECIYVNEGVSLEGEIVRYSKCESSPTLGKNKKVEQHIRKKTRKPNALRFWVEGGVIPLYVGSVLILVRSPRCLPPRILSTSGIKADDLRLGNLVSKVFLMEVSGKHVLYKCVNGDTSKGSVAFARGGVYQCGRGTHT